MSDSKTYVFSPEGGNSDAMTAAMMNGGCGGAMWNNPIWALVFLGVIGNGNFFGNNGRRNEDVQFVSSQLGQAIAGNANALSNLSTHLDCSIGQIQTGIAAVQNAIQNVATQTGMSALQVINAVERGNSSIQNMISSCCCELKTTTERGFSNLAYENAAQACSIKQSISDQTATVIAKLDAMEDSRKDREIASLTAALTAANSRAERQAELAPIYKSLADIECKQPKTETVYAPSVATVPQCVAWTLGLAGSPLSTLLATGNGGIFG